MLLMREFSPLAATRKRDAFTAAPPMPSDYYISRGRRYSRDIYSHAYYRRHNLKYTRSDVARRGKGDD